MSQSLKNHFEISLVVARIDPPAGGDQVVLTDDDTEIILPKKYLPKSLAAGERVVLTIEPESNHADQKTRAAKDILNEILKP